MFQTSYRSFFRLTELYHVIAQAPGPLFEVCIIYADACTRGGTKLLAIYMCTYGHERLY